MSGDKIEIAELSDPRFLAYHEELKAFLRNFLETHIKIPSITYESFMSYLFQNVQAISNVSPHDRWARFFVGFKNGKIAGFVMVKRNVPFLPFVAQMDVPYIVATDPRITYLFNAEIKKLQKLWRAKHIGITVVDPSKVRVYLRAFKNAKVCGTWIVTEGMKDAYCIRNDSKTAESGAVEKPPD